MADEQKQPENDTQPDAQEPQADDAQEPEMIEPAADEPVGEAERERVEDVPDAPPTTPDEVAEDAEAPLTTQDEFDGAEDKLPEAADYDPARDEGEQLPDAENVFEESVSDAIDEAGDLAQESDTVQAYDEAVEDVMEEMSDVAEGDPVSMTDEHAHSDTVTLPVLGTFEVYGGIYTVVFVALAVLTLIEVITAEAFPPGAVQIVALMLAAVAKAALVVMFYMHLRTDNRIFLLVLALPSIVVLISVLYLMAVPVGAGLGYN